MNDDNTIDDLRIALATEKYLANECAILVQERDATISDLREQLKARDQTIADLRERMESIAGVSP